MYVSEFYDPCKDKHFFQSLQEKSANFVFAEQLRLFLDTITDFSVSEKNVSLMRDLLTTGLKGVRFDYNWESETFLGDAVQKTKNLLKWLDESFDGKVRSSAMCSYNGYEQNVSLIVKKGNTPYAIIVGVGKNKFSPKGRSVLTISANNLAGLIVKGSLNSEFPGIRIAQVYLSSDKDKIGNISDSFIINDTKSSNVYIFDDMTIDTVNERIALVTSQQVTSSCADCRYASLCKAKNKKKVAAPPSEKEVKPYVMPHFTESQLRVVTHKDGPLLVVAPPGSGKTATLVGRIAYLMKQGVDPAFILAISFTKAAAKELSERVSSFCTEDDIPTCSTINALALNILTQNEKIVGKVKTLTKRENMSVIDEILSVLDPLPDFNYSVKTGSRGLLATAGRWLDTYKSLNFDKDDFRNEKRGEVSDAFYEFADIYFNRIKAQGYITYDEQVDMASSFLEEYPDALADYQRLFKYVMVDEYQDVNASQARLIYLLAGHGNIVVVGDDDQSIYGFRGAKPQVMRDFALDFGAPTVELKENFRSTAALFDASKDVVKLNNRIDKEGIAVRKGGEAPIYHVGCGLEDVKVAITDALKKGYKYRDIAVLAGKNKVLEELDNNLDCPTILQKALVVDTDLFNVIYYGLKLQMDPANKEASWRLKQLIGEGDALYDSILQIRDVNSLIENMADFVSATAEETDALKAVCEESQVESIEDMYSLLEYMVNFEDDTRVDVVSNRSDEVLLITSHESKGLEFPVVILIDDQKARTTDEERRVLYVSMTRAKDRLYILKSA